MPAFMWLDADDVARESYDAVMAGVPVYVPGRVNRSIADARPRVLPRRVVLGALMKRNAPADFREDLTIAERPAGACARRLRIGRVSCPRRLARTVARADTVGTGRHLMLTDLRYAVRWLRRSPGIRRRRHPLARPRHRRQHRDVLARRRGAAATASGRRIPATLVDVFTSSSDGDEYATTSYPGLPRPEGAEHGLQRHDWPTRRCLRRSASAIARGWSSASSSPRITSTCSACGRCSAACCSPRTTRRAPSASS